MVTCGQTPGVILLMVMLGKREPSSDRIEQQSLKHHEGTTGTKEEEQTEGQIWDILCAGLGPLVAV